MQRAVLAILLSYTSLAYGLDMDYYAYDGFDQVRNGFERVALVFGDVDYASIATTFAILGLVFGGMIAAGRSLINFGGSFTYGWVFMTLFGTAVFQGLILNTGTMHVFDPVQNRYQAVAGVPDLIIAVAGTLNKVERAAVEIIDDNPAEPIADRYGGVGFSILYNIMEDSSGIEDHYLFKTLKTFYRDCSPIALADPANVFNIQDVRSNTVDLMATFANLALPSVSTTWYSPANKAGVIDTCQNVWNVQLAPAMGNINNFDDLIYASCRKAGFDTTDIIGQARCRGIVDTLSPTMFNTAGDALHLMRTRLLNLALQEAITDPDPDVGIAALANQGTVMEGLGTSIVASNWLPTVKATMTVIVLGITPILVLFMVTPLFAKAFVLTIGLFGFVAIWGVTDAVLQVGAMDQAIAALEEMRRHNMGIDAMILAPEASQKGMAIFAKARALGLTLASILTGGLLGVSVYGLASAGGRLEEPVEAKGADAAKTVNTAEGYGSYIDASVQGYSAGIANAGAGGFAQASGAQAFGRASNVFSDQQTYEGISSDYGTGLTDSASLAASTSAGSRMGALTGTSRSAKAQGMDGADPSVLMATSASTSDTEMQQRIGASEGVRQAVPDDGTGGAIHNNAAFNSARQLSQTTGQSEVFNDKAQSLQYSHHERTGEELTFQQASTTLARFEQADLESNIRNFNGNSDDAVQFRTDQLGLTVAQQDGFIMAAERMSVSPFALSEAQGTMSGLVAAGDDKALSQLPLADVMMAAAANRIMSTADSMGSAQVYQNEDFYQTFRDVKENDARVGRATSEQVDRVASFLDTDNQRAANAIVGAHTAFTATQEQLQTAAPGIDPAFSGSATEGALISASVDSEGDIARYTADAGNSQYFNDQTTFRTGTSVSSQGSLVFDKSQEEPLSEFLQANESDTQAMQALKRDTASLLSSFVQSRVSVAQDKASQTFAGASVQPGGVLSQALGLRAEAGQRFSFTGNINDTDTIDAQYAAVDAAFDRASNTAKNETNEWARTEASSGNVVSADTREEYYFDRYASNINSEITQTVSNAEELLEEHANWSEVLEQENKTDAKADREDGNASGRRRGPPGRRR